MLFVSLVITHLGLLIRGRLAAPTSARKSVPPLSESLPCLCYSTVRLGAAPCSDCLFSCMGRVSTMCAFFSKTIDECACRSHQWCLCLCWCHRWCLRPWWRHRRCLRPCWRHLWCLRPCWRHRWCIRHCWRHGLCLGRIPNLLNSRCNTKRAKKVQTKWLIYEWANRTPNINLWSCRHFFSKRFEVLRRTVLNFRQSHWGELMPSRGID